MPYVFDEETGEYVWEDEEPEDGGGFDPSKSPEQRYGETWGIIGYTQEPAFGPDGPTGRMKTVPKYGWRIDRSVRAPSNRAPTDPALTAYREAQADALRKASEYKQERDIILDEERKEKEKYQRAIDEGRYKDAEAIRQRMTALQERGQALDESFRRDNLKLQADLGYAGSRRADLQLNLNRQGQAFNQEMELRRTARETASRPSSYLEYAFDTAGVAAPPGTRLAEIQGRIKQTPDVESYLAGQYGTPQDQVKMTPSGQTVASGPPMQYDENSVIQELEANRKRQQGVA